MKKKTLAEICNVVSGGTPSRSKLELWNDGDIPWIKIGNESMGTVLFDSFLPDYTMIKCFRPPVG